MLDRQSVSQILGSLDWSHGYNREDLLQTLLDRNVALPNEFLSAIEPTEVFYTPGQLLQSVPDVVWTIHDERERRARGHLERAAATARSRMTRVE